MRPIWKILIAMAVVVVAVVALLTVIHYRAKAAVTAYRTQLIAKGEKLTIAELTPSVSAADLSAGRDLANVASSINPFTNVPPMMRPVAPGRVLLASAETVLPAQLTNDCWPEFTAIVKAHPEITEGIAAALRKPGLAFDVNYTNRAQSTPAWAQLCAN